MYYSCNKIVFEEYTSHHSTLDTPWIKHRFHLLFCVVNIQNFLLVLSFIIAQIDEELSHLAHFKCLDSCNQNLLSP